VSLSDPRVTWHNPRILTTLLLVFLCGAAAGSVATRRFFRPKPQRPLAVYWAEGGKAMTLAKFRKELDLTDDQAKQLEAVIDDFVNYYQSLQAQMDEVRADGKVRMLKVLSPDQKLKFEKMLAEMKDQARLR
jgi:Spy/CpxP family protein refolding chaperone